jgi:dTDP-4-dehydrorhamnose reductase
VYRKITLKLIHVSQQTFDGTPPIVISSRRSANRVSKRGIYKTAEKLPVKRMSEDSIIIRTAWVTVNLRHRKKSYKYQCRFHLEAQAIVNDQRVDSTAA